MLSKSPSKDHISLTSGEGSLPPSDVELPQGADLARQPGGVSRDSARKRDESKGKSSKAKGTLKSVVNEDESKEVIPDYHDNPWDVLETMFERYSEEGCKPPSAVLHYASTVSPPFVKSFGEKFCFSGGLRYPAPYTFRAPGPRERVCFPREGEIGVYCAFFTFGLRFPLDGDVERILCYYKIPLCQYSPTAIRAILAFLSLT